MLDKKALTKIVKKLPKAEKPWQMIPYGTYIVAVNPEYVPHMLTRNWLRQYVWVEMKPEEIDPNDPVMKEFQANNRRRGLLSLNQPRVVKKPLAGQ